MISRRLLQRISRLENALRQKGIFGAECICFPEREPPTFPSLEDENTAAKLKCPLHGQRFWIPEIHISVPVWLEAKLPEHLWTAHGEQYRKAWFATFPRELWPPPGEEKKSKGGTDPSSRNV